MKNLSNVYNEINQLSKNNEFMPTGFNKLDNFLDGGFVRKELVVIGGATGSGKSYLSAQIFLNVAKKGFKTAYFSLEISNEMIVSRLIGQIANVKPTRLLYGLLTPEENTAKIRAKAELNPYEVLMEFSDDTYKLVDIEKEIVSNGYDFVVIDFVQNVLTNKQDEYSSMSFVSLELQRIAKKNNCCILVLSQLSNSASKSGFLEYKGSGGIAMVADLGFFIVKPEEKDKQEFILELRKNRRGISGVPFAFTFGQTGGRINEKF